MRLTVYLPAQLPGVMVSGLCVTVTGPPQLSLATTPESSAGGICEAQDTVRSAGHWVMTGGLVSLTVIVCVQFALLLHASLAVYVRLTVYLPEQLPGVMVSGLCVTVTGPPQLSLATTPESSGGGTCDAHDTVTSAGHWVITGALVSLTVMVCVQLTLLLQESLAL